jgi:hypothetical protein
MKGIKGMSGDVIIDKFSGFHGTINALGAPLWERIAARLFGEKHVFKDNGWTLTAYSWRGTIYVLKHVKPQPTSKD